MIIQKHLESSIGIAFKVAVIFVCNVISANHCLAKTSNNLYSSITFSLGETYYDKLGLDAAISSFIGSPNEASGSSSSSFIESVEVSYNTKVKVVSPNHSLGIKITKYFSDESLLPSFLQIGYRSGISRFYLPNGLKPFVEPINITTNYSSWDATIGATFDFNLPHSYRLFSSFGFQKSIAQIQTNVSSPILKIETDERHSPEKYFISLFGEFSEVLKFEPCLQYSHYQDGYSDITFTINLPISH
jgi:hypothetical protein